MKQETEEVINEGDRTKRRRKKENAGGAEGSEKFIRKCEWKNKENN